MKIGKERIYQQPVNEITWLSAYAQQWQAEAEARGEALPPAIRLQIGEPSFRTPEHIRQAAIRSIECEPLTYAPAVGQFRLRELLAEKIQRINGYAVEP